MPSSKKAKKDAKEGGVVAAVTKHAAKFSNSTAQGFGSDTSLSSAVQSPEIRPVGTPSSSNGIPTASPLLDAVSAPSFGGGTAITGGGEWARPIPALAGSPGNLISIMGDSPPTQPSSYEEPRAIPYGWASPRPYVNSPSVSASPPNPARRPLSFQMDARYQASDAAGPTASSGLRRSSLHSHTTQPRVSPNPPLPHQPQPHFYGVPNMNFDVEPQKGLAAGERSYHFAFDTLPTPNSHKAPGTDTVVTAGYEGGLEVYSVTKRGLEYLASLKGLRGGVHHAKILPWISRGDGSEIFPLVAVVINGPVLPPSSPEANIQGENDGGMSERSGSSPPPPNDVMLRDGMGVKSPLPVEFYQTSVELYSLKTSKLVEVLLEAPKIQLKTSITSPIFQAPPPSGAFQIKADSGNIVVTSGITGESWVFRQVDSPQHPGFQFRCVAKLWTTLQQPPRIDATQETDRSRTAAVRQAPRHPIIALNGRWISYCPSAPSSQMALRASVPLGPHGKAPGFNSLTPPQLPPVNSDLEVPNGESVVNKLMRDATQEIISGAKWVGQQGWQALNNYWKGSTAPQPPRSPPLGSQPWGNPYQTRQEATQFPPTHGAMAPAVAKEPGIVSILDVETLGTSASLHPTASFPVPLGCSFLSFSPTGLSLFTASTKGDVQTVWDLMRLQHTKASPLQVSPSPGIPTGPRVRQIAQFSRMTVTRIVDIAWTKPNGERIAVVTERGTVHVLELPSSAFTWPPPRRRTREQEAKGSPEGAVSGLSYASSVFSSAMDTARPLLSRPRRSSSNIPQSTGATIVDHASHGGKIIAAGISHSLGRTGHAINHLRHTGDNRLTVQSIFTGSSCAMWVTGKRQSSLFILISGGVRTFMNRTHKSPGGASGVGMPRLSRAKDYKLPGLPSDVMAIVVKRYLDPEEYLELTDQNDAGNNTMVLDSRLKPSPEDLQVESSIPQAEIESSAPYQPFHTDRRVALFEYDSKQQTLGLQLQTVSVLLADTSLEDRPAPPNQRKKGAKKADILKGPNTDGAWAFGQPIVATQLDTGYARLSDEESSNFSTDDVRALPPSAIERVLQHVGDNDEQIVVTTRRRRGGGNRAADQDQDGFFEDDCEVLDFADQRV